MKQERYDLGKIIKHEITPEGYLRCLATVARTGIQIYRNDDGSERRELRLPEEVGKPESLATFGLKPHTLNHPPEFVNSHNIKKYQTGTSDSTVFFDQGFVRVVLNITDEATIKEIVSGRKEQISCGYYADVIHEPGVWNGEHYDAIQTNIYVNHIASVAEGRAGANVKVHTDASDNKKIVVNSYKKDMRVSWKQEDTICVGKITKTYSEPIERTVDGAQITKDGSAENPVLEIQQDSGGTVFKLASEVKPDMEQEQEQQDSVTVPAKQDSEKEDNLTSRVSTLDAILADKRADIARLSTENSKLHDEKAKAQHDAKVALSEVDRLKAERNDAISAEVTKRLDAWNLAKELLPKTMIESPDPTLTATAIMRAAIENTSPNTKLDGVTDDYIKGCFETIRNQPKADKTAYQWKAVTEAFEGSREDAGKAKNKHQQDSANAWMITN